MEVGAEQLQACLHCGGLEAVARSIEAVGPVPAGAPFADRRGRRTAAAGHRSARLFSRYRSNSRSSASRRAPGAARRKELREGPGRRRAVAAR